MKQPNFGDLESFIGDKIIVRAALFNQEEGIHTFADTMVNPAPSCPCSTKSGFTRCNVAAVLRDGVVITVDEVNLDTNSVVFPELELISNLYSSEKEELRPTTCSSCVKTWVKKEEK